jgi:hypothetical protein
LLALGEIESAGAEYSLEISIDQRRWPGGVGLFCGLERDPAGELLHCEVVELAPRSELDGTQSLGLRHFSVAAVHGVLGAESVFAWLDVPEPVPGEHRLRADVRHGAVEAIYWDGEELPRPARDVEGARDEWLPAAFGVYVRDAEAMFQTASFTLAKGRAHALRLPD